MLNENVNKLLALAEELRIAERRTEAEDAVVRLAKEVERLTVLLRTRPEHRECPTCNEVWPIDFDFCPRCGEHLPVDKEEGVYLSFWRNLCSVFPGLMDGATDTPGAELVSYLSAIFVTEDIKKALDGMTDTDDGSLPYIIVRGGVVHGMNMAPKDLVDKVLRKCAVPLGRADKFLLVRDYDGAKDAEPGDIGFVEDSYWYAIVKP